MTQRYGRTVLTINLHSAQHTSPDLHCQSIMKYYLSNILPDLQSYPFALWTNFVFSDTSLFCIFFIYIIFKYIIFFIFQYNIII